MTNKEKRFFEIADSVSRLSNHPKAKLGCIIISHKRILSSGFNSNTKTHTKQKRLDTIRFKAESTGKIHAETQALLPLINSHADLSKAELYISRRLKDNSLAMSRPCPSCMALIRSCGIKTIHYTTSEGYAKESIK